MSRADERKYHYIYKITRIDGSGKYYIGMHSTDNLEDGYFGSGTLLAKSVKKHGKEKHFKEILEHLDSRLALRNREKEIVNVECIADLLCMNLQLGGGGGFPTKEQQIKATLAGNSSIKRNYEVACKKATATKLARGTLKVPNPQTYGMLGKKHTAVTKLKMSQSGRGKLNSQFGTCWVTNGLISVKIKKQQVNEYLKSGYLFGRVITK